MPDRERPTARTELAQKNPLTRARLRRTVDLGVALLGLIAAAPGMLVLAGLIRLDSPGPIFYRAPMIGHNGQPFTLFRFRTMTAARAPVAGPRLTRLGAFLRNYSLDHLPMLLNLLRGDLTLVGPRPMEPRAVDWQDPAWREYFAVRPGLLNYAVLQLGRRWAASRVSHPALNQALELEYRRSPAAGRDWRLVRDTLRAFIASRGNLKARGKPTPEAERRLQDEP